MVKFIMLVGLPASGKSTIAQKINEKSVILSSDQLRVEIFNNINDIEHSGQVFEEMNKRTKEYLKQGTTVIYDATNISSKRRMNFLKQLNKIDCYKECYFIFRDIEKCIYRDSKRERLVGKEVITRMRNSLCIPQYYEGWDNITIDYDSNRTTSNTDMNFNINSYNDYIKLLNEKYYLNRCVDMPQDNPYHVFSLSRHMYKTYEYVINNNCSEEVKIASLFHDIGKAYCKEFKDDGYAHYYGHEFISAQLTMKYLLEETQLNINSILYITGLIQLHMRMFNIEGYGKLRKCVGTDIFNNLMLLHNGDNKAK